MNNYYESMLEKITDDQLKKCRLLRYRRPGTTPETYLVHWTVDDAPPHAVHGLRLFDDLAYEVAAKITHAANPDTIGAELDDWLSGVHQDFIDWVREQVEEQQ